MPMILVEMENSTVAADIITGAEERMTMEMIEMMELAVSSDDGVRRW